MIELVTFDLDGVLIKEYCWSSKLFEKHYGIPWQEFYAVLKKNKFLERKRNHGPTFKLMEDLFDRYNVKITEEKFWDIWLNNFESDKEIIDLALKIKKSGKKIGIISDNPHERADYLRENLKWIKEFNYTLFSSDFGVTKKNPKLFEILIEKSGLKPEEIFFTDDDEKNVEVARKSGINSEIYNNVKELKNKLEEFGIEIR
ncbi:MAG: HAD-IA family hydrolase [Candidatus Aenigmarchaeota archaeon]|nr:HAD-IA family hydrolase [Candidatus Aenigmarchaeota archaeon]